MEVNSNEHAHTHAKRVRAHARRKVKKMKNREITEHEREAYKRARELYYKKIEWGPINAKNEDTLTCWIYMRMVYYGWKTFYGPESIPETLEELEKWEKIHELPFN